MTLAALDIHDFAAARRRRPIGAAAFDPFAPALEAVADRIGFDAQEEIYAEQDPALYIYKVVSGTVRICRLLEDGSRQIVAFLFAGDHFGLELGEDHVFSAEAVEPSEVLLFDRRTIESLARTNNSVALRLWELTAASVRKLQDHILVLGRMNARAKIATFLLGLSERTASRDVRLCMPRHDIGDHLGLTLETVSRTIRQLEVEEFLALPDARSVTLRNVHGLRRLVA